MEQHTNDTIKDKVLETITNTKLQPTSRWRFRAQHAVLWVPGVLVTSLGAFAIAGILFSTVHAGWQYRPYTHQSVAGFLREAIPLVWLGSLVLFGAVIVKALRLTAQGYRYKTGLIIAASFCTSVMLGAALFALDMTTFKNKLIRFHAERSQQTLWTSPEDGRLAGVLDITEDGAVSLVDTTGKAWVLDTTELIGKELLKDGASVRVVGLIDQDASFVTCVLFPWELSPIDRDGREARPPRGKLLPLSEKSSGRCADIFRIARPPQPALVP